MKFNRLRVLGFKSFVEPSEFVIERGLTGVVGPNGCGKSNLVEALRWVMGESSYKNMRASGMDDVIFSGSATRPARNTAEVTLFLDNADRTAPAGFNDVDELQVSRRIEREAGSVYRINGKEARAKDVQLLFADQSTGARSPSMVGQGRIGELIQAKPQARRALLEEAAGISGLHSRRHEAELRLRAAEQNLERLDDVVGELESQIENLKRQARQATRYKNVSADIRKTEATLLHLRWSQAKEQEAEAKSALAVATTAVGDRAAQQMQAAKDQAVAAHKLPELREAEAAAAAALQRLSIAKGQIEEEAARLAERQTELGKRLAQLETDIARENQIIADNAEVLVRLEEEERTLNAEQAGAADREVEAKSSFEQAGAKLKASEAELATITARRAEAAAERGQFERALREAAERRQRAEARIQASDAELSDIAARIAALADPAEKQQLVDAALQSLETAEQGARGAEKTVADARAAEAAARPPLQEARAEFGRIETEARTLAKVLSAGTGDLFPAVLEQVSVDRGFEAALGAALGEDLDVPLDRSSPVHWNSIAPAADDPILPDSVRPLAEFVRAPAELSRRLRQIGLVEEGQGEALQSALKVGQALVSPKGALWRWDGYRASADAPTAAAQRLAQKNRLAELEAEVEGARAAVTAAETILAQAEATTRQAGEADRAAREEVRRAQATLGEAREALARAEKAAGDLVSRRSALEEARSGLFEARDEAAAAVAAAEQGLAAAPDPAALQEELDRHTSVVATDRGSLADARAAHDGLAREAAARVRRLETIVADRQKWLERAGNADSHIKSLRARRDEAAREAAELEDAPNEIELRRRALMTQLSEAEMLRRKAADRLAEAESRQKETDKAATEALEALSHAREARVRAEERVMAGDERRKEIEARIREVLNVPPHLVSQHAGLEPDQPLPEMGEMERRLERLKIERERLGAVNLRAEDEQKELSERLEAIIADREDIIEAIRKLRGAIQSLNREGRERLLAAFEVVNGHFQRLFAHLFGGGTAQLQLIESDDPLEAGLEILARPPGKRPQTMTLLSGGEQALTAMALIFAVFLTNPAPICVLDEVDAPLDDHNVERFCNLMDEMAETTDTRFVIITHNPITMARVNRLFGVTMPEQGVSQLVSVDLETAEQLREAS
ncbi:chromosome segregation protein SMC [Chelativorans sp. ZYF759]|uniref:chromosome segregation protein SMC n=1 Tax=Chelativorans sp. ZYF759 TaxID=2692213 RepID=UPI00145E1C62|nr:chromosome segregation protein SMC [Chelativorans sp. ZYF759]NMG38910.1 chromosome segregation protein SMC [Chelativorans sp. ZYF759]